MISLGIELPSWAGLVLIGGVLLFFFPLFIKNAKIKQARVLWKDSFFAPIEERKNLQEEALALVQGNSSGLLGLVEMAIQSSQLKLAEQTLQKIETDHPNLSREIRRLRFRIDQRSRNPSL